MKNKMRINKFIQLESKLFATLDDYFIKIWSLLRNECISKIKIQQFNTPTFLLYAPSVLIIQRDYDITFFNYITAKTIRKIENHNLLNLYQIR
jgi:hypothetical protein